MSSKGRSSDETLKDIGALIVAVLAIAFFPIAIFWVGIWKEKWQLRLRARYYAMCGVLLIVSFGCLYALKNQVMEQKHQKTLRKIYGPAIAMKELGFGLSSFWVFGLCGSVFLVPLAERLRPKRDGIRKNDFTFATENKINMKDSFGKSNSLPLGTDVKDHHIVSLDEQRRTAHSLVVGSTGTGKTTLMINMILHAIKHNQPCVVIDPKGDASTLNEIRKLGQKLDSNFQKRLEVFTISNIAQSLFYNPLKHGNANKIKDRILEALNWSEQYYQSMSANFLTFLIASYEFLGETPTLSKIYLVITQKEEQVKLMTRIKDESKQNSSKSNTGEKLVNALIPFFTKSKEDVLSGLASQIAILDNPTFGQLLSFESAENEIDLRRARKESKIVYFQLDTLGNPDSARRLGRMIIEDLKSLASEVYETERNEMDRPFFPIFIDEFGSFASKEFIEFLKQSRGAKFGVHLFCQGFEDLDVVSPEFGRQVISNTMTKIGFRMDDNKSVNEMCATAGTFDAEERSYQVSGTLIESKTGLGNLRETKQMQIEHDVFKNLRNGEAVVIQKGINKISGIKTSLGSSLI